MPYILVATGAGLLGGIVARFWNPKVQARSAIQHFAAGAVLAAVAANVIPEVERLGSTLGVLAGFTLGGLAMIGLKWIVVKVEHEEKRAHRLPAGLAAAAAVDTLPDGMIISAGFSSDQQLGTLLVVALSLELFFLTLSVGAAALIYLIAEELLVESIQAEASLLSTAMLFAGFLVLLALKLFGKGDS